MSVISEEALQEIVEVVWMTALELPVEPGKQDDMAHGQFMTSQIRISGAWSGVVKVRASNDFLQHAASLMFSCGLEDVTEMDLSDSLTELTNMLGGTVKCLLPEICDLALPVVLAGDATGDDEDEWVCFSCAGKPLAVAVAQRAEGAQQAA